MKKLKKLTALVLVMALISSFSAFAEDKDVEISFKVGESTLMVNGNALTVETPYVAGEGVTLVPLRVITEAFGAEVTWDGETKSIALKYPGVDILLTIGSKIAEVNKKAETLLEAPALSESGVTMVPLRFISETFGAEVSYDDKTSAIKVTLRKKTDGGKTVAGAVTEDFIGDSYYGWTIENPKDMTMTDRNFDGSYTEFSKDDNNGFYIVADTIEDDFSFDEYYSDIKNSFSGTTLVKAEKGESDGVRTMHFQARSKESFVNMLCYFTDKYMYIVYGVFSDADEAAKNEYIRITESFKLSFSKDGTYDLSTVVDGMRTFKSDLIALEMNVPANYYLLNEDESINSFRFVKNSGGSYIHIAVTSKSDAKSASELAEKDRKLNSEVMNEALVTTSEISECEYAGISGSFYTQTIKGSLKSDGIIKDVFFDNGDYVYNISVMFNTEEDKNDEELMEKILSSVKVKTPDSSKIGTVLRNDLNRDDVRTVKNTNYTFKLPMSFEEITSSATSGTYIDQQTGIAINYTQEYTDVTTKKSDVKNLVSELEKRNRQKKEEIVRSSSDTILNTRLYTYYVYKSVSEKDASYVAVYLKLNQNSIDIITILYPELTYSKANIQMMETALGTIEVK